MILILHMRKHVFGLGLFIKSIHSWILISTCVGMFLDNIVLFFFGGLFIRSLSHLNEPCNWRRASYHERIELLSTSLKMNASTFMSLITNSTIM
ncbi:hypothetical protein H5410_023558 [Solanum commersonii]|uniref:Uncharacterized protein n=1 Tax=Solanum commersonii TaxID=4109 RepID=A0A9J5ZIG9_SOLCO|nr:hypothetical protein H5410_023558 [Solanum commersonii]